MGTTKKLVVLCLVLLMGIAAIMPSTFSWYDHNGSFTGVRMSYEREDLPVSAGTISTSTRKYYMENEKKPNGSVNAVYYDIKGNKEYNGGAISGTQTVAANTSQYYGTTITNTANSPAYVNLYLQNFKNNNNFYVGTMEPSLRDKGVSPSVHLKNKNSIRVYFQFGNANDWNANGAKKYVVCTNKSGNTTVTQITNHIKQGAANSSLLARQTEILGSNITNTYYVDLADDTTSFYFATDANKGGLNTSTGATALNWYRTNTITNVQSERGYWLTGKADDTSFCAAYESFDVPGGISVMKYFDTAEINQGQKAFVSLTKGIHYTGSTISYSGSGGLTVNAGSGMITRTGTGSGSVTTTITGSLGDTKTITTSVTTPTEVAAMPLAMNIKVPAAKTEDGVTTNGEAHVVWYIRNEAASSCTFDSIYYTK